VALVLAEDLKYIESKSFKRGKSEPGLFTICRIAADKNNQAMQAGLSKPVETLFKSRF
jgi:hypothetical protein